MDGEHERDGGGAEQEQPHVAGGQHDTFQADQQEEDRVQDLVDERPELEQVAHA